ncbi:MAG: hypothetical protein BWX78_01792 [Firmicutes bacterium ADurb.Bin099]|nr:MAG: hypothetical protein BWX78_01792 [Firmicutes bacterium ADurb.Bin099]
MWCPFVMSVTTGILRCLTSFASDCGKTALVPHNEYRASGYRAIISPFLAILIRCLISIGSLVNFLLHMQPTLRNSHSRFMYPSIATT